MKKESIRFTGILLKILERVLNIKFEILGEENIPKEKSVLFCPNHFTRFETFILPYILTKIPNLKYTRSLTHQSLFFGKFGEYLESVKAVSTSNPERDNIIISDLTNNLYNWIIYPEGQMAKDKKIFTSKPKLWKRYKMLKFSAKTGAATLAMKAEMEAKNKGEICICPITISYRPIHAKRNKLFTLIRAFINTPKLPKRVKEEMFFESSLLAFSTITIEFHKPIVVAEYINKAKLIPESLKLEYLRFPLTNEVMFEVYRNTPLTFDHFFSFCVFSLAFAGITKIEIKLLKEIIFQMIAKSILLKAVNITNSINQFNVCKLILKDEKNEMLETSLKEMELKGLGFVKNDNLYIEKNELLKEQDFHEIRIKNIFKVLLNEFSYFNQLVHILQGVVLKSFNKIKQENGELMFKLLELDFEMERKHAGVDVKPFEIGVPVLNLIGEIGVLLCHGFKAAPMENYHLAKALNNAGFSTYSLRLKGHGTTPEEMQIQTAEIWILSHAMAFEAFSRLCAKVFMCGFSMGGLLSIINAKRFENAGLITISAPLKIADFKFYFAGIVDEFSSLLQNFKKDVKNFVMTKSENPEVNYEKNYFSALNQLKTVMKKANESLVSVDVPCLVIQGMGDDVISADSGKRIYAKIASAKKELFEFNAGEKHIIIQGQGSDAVFSKIISFIQRN